MRVPVTRATQPLMRVLLIGVDARVGAQGARLAVLAAPACREPLLPLRVHELAVRSFRRAPLHVETQLAPPSPGGAFFGGAGRARPAALRSAPLKLRAPTSAPPYQAGLFFGTFSALLR